MSLENGGKELRGLINHPKFFGGWGVLVEPSGKPILVNNTATPFSIGGSAQNRRVTTLIRNISLYYNTHLSQNIMVNILTSF